MQNQTSATALWDISLVMSETSFRSRQTIYNKMARENFPLPVKCGTRTQRWIAAEVQAWIKDRIDATRNQKQMGGRRS